MVQMKAAKINYCIYYFQYYITDFLQMTMLKIDETALDLAF